ncbi:MAG TPA: hypothetical protein VKT72_01715 [Candidatus Baltobacteraceae bacterium]|nr:hypothetical protein [Candidatus Baltobacteraceae bacterium]
MKVSAPGDEYFGRMKMSYLGINNTFHDDAIRAGEYTTDPRLISSIEWADEALTAWAKKYPNDPQLARSYFLAFLMYRKVYTPIYQQKAWDYAHIVIKKWPSSYFGKALTKDLGIGYTEYYFATPVPCTVLDPSAVPTGMSKGAPTPTPAALTSSPSPSPTPSPRPGQPKVSILPVPCIAPSPSPSPEISGSPSPGARSTPSPAASTSASPSPSPSSKP